MELNGIESGLGINKVFPSTDNVKQPTAIEGAGKFFSELVSKVNDLQVQSDHAIQGLASGQNKNLHEVMISMEKANVSFLFMSQVRNKAIEAYQEIMRMQM